MSIAEQFIRDLENYHPLHLSEDGRLVVIPSVNDMEGQRLAVEVSQLDGSDSGPWPDAPPRKICYSARAEPAQPKGIPPLSGKEASTPDKHWDRYSIDLSAVWSSDLPHKPEIFLKVAIGILGED